MSRMGQLIYTNAYDYKVYGVVTREKSSTRLSIELYVVSPDTEEMTEIFTLPKKDVIRKKNCFDFLIGLEGDFTRDDIDSIRNKVGNLLSGGSDMVDIQSKATMRELHQAISDYIRENEEQLKDNPDADCFIKEGYGYMNTGKMKEFLEENKELNFKRVDVLRSLKIMGVLKPSKKRTYDVAVRVSDRPRWFYKIELAEPSEVTDIEEVAVK